MDIEGRWSSGKAGGAVKELRASADLPLC